MWYLGKINFHAQIRQEILTCYINCNKFYKTLRLEYWNIMLFKFCNNMCYRLILLFYKSFILIFFFNENLGGGVIIDHQLYIRIWECYVYLGKFKMFYWRKLIRKAIQRPALIDRFDDPLYNVVTVVSVLTIHYRGLGSIPGAERIFHL